MGGQERGGGHGVHIKILSFPTGDRCSPVPADHWSKDSRVSGHFN